MPKVYFFNVLPYTRYYCIIAWGEFGEIHHNSPSASFHVQQWYTSTTIITWGVTNVSPKWTQNILKLKLWKSQLFQNVFQNLSSLCVSNWVFTWRGLIRMEICMEESVSIRMGSKYSLLSSLVTFRQRSVRGTYPLKLRTRLMPLSHLFTREVPSTFFLGKNIFLRMKRANLLTAISLVV